MVSDINAPIKYLKVQVLVIEWKEITLEKS